MTRRKLRNRLRRARRRAVAHTELVLDVVDPERIIRRWTETALKVDGAEIQMTSMIFHIGEEPK